MGDGAREITKAGKEVFGNEGKRLMCWPHTYRNLVPQMSAIRNLNKKLQLQLMSDKTKLSRRITHLKEDVLLALS